MAKRATKAKTVIAAEPVERIVISAPKIRTVQFKIVGDAPYMQARFSEKAINIMRATHEAGSQAKSKKSGKPAISRAITRPPSISASMVGLAFRLALSVLPPLMCVGSSASR